MLINVMDFDPRIMSNEHGWYCNFHFGYGDDIIEDVENEKCCVQALQCLIAKADAEIHNLEDELAILQCQLKWADSNEPRNPYEVCCAAFKRKIDFLTESVKNVRNRNVLNEHDTDTTIKIQRPTDRICDIINVLLKEKLSEADEQLEDLLLPDEIESTVNSGSVVDIGTDLKQKEPTSESPAVSKELSPDFESLYKHADTVSEESCSDTARYATWDSIEAKSVSKTIVEVTGSTEVDAFECTAEASDGFLGSSKANNGSGNSKPNNLPLGDEIEGFEEWLTGLKTSGSDSLDLSAKEKVTVKVEEDDNDTGIQPITADALCKVQDHKSESPIEAHQEVKYFQPQGFNNIQITYERKKPSLSSLLLTKQKPKVQRNNSSGARQYNPSLMQKPQWKVGKKELHPNVDNGQTSSLPESICHQESVGIAHINQPQLFGGKKRKLSGASKEDANNPFQKATFSKKIDLCARKTSASNSQNEMVVCLEAPSIADGVASPHVSIPPDPHDVESNNTIVEVVGTKDSPAFDLEGLKSKFSQDPKYLNKMTVLQLKEILKLYKVRGVSKWKKEKVIEELSKQLKNS